MSTLNIRQIEDNVKAAVAKCDEESFIYDLLLAYGLPKATIKRQQLHQGQSSLFFPNDVAFKKKVYFRIDKEHELPLVVSELADESGTAIKSTHPRFVIATDFKRFMAIDTKTKNKHQQHIRQHCDKRTNNTGYPYQFYFINTSCKQAQKLLCNMHGK